MDFKALNRLHKTNNEVAWLISDYLNSTPCAITSSDWEEMNDPSLPPESLFAAYMAGICGLDLETETDFSIYNDYLLKSVHCLNVAIYQSNPYYQHIHFPELTRGHWQLTHSEYAPYEAFVSNDILFDGLKEIPQVGFFTTPFPYPVVKENGREWMAIKPSEIESMRQPVAVAHGRVITFGLGLGYYAYMVSLKSEVESVTIVERDAEVISLFKEVILPQFEYKEKVSIVQSDAFQFMEHSMSNHYDFAFVDLWHDTLDGKELYLRSKSLEHCAPYTEWHYWVENLLLSSLRWQAWDEAIKTSSSAADAQTLLCDKNWLIATCRND